MTEPCVPVTRAMTLVVAPTNALVNRRAFAGTHVEVAEAVEQVAADLRAESIRDLEGGPRQRARGSERAVDDDLRRDARAVQRGRERGDEERRVGSVRRAHQNRLR